MLNQLILTDSWEAKHTLYYLKNKVNLTTSALCWRGIRSRRQDPSSGVVANKGIRCSLEPRRHYHPTPESRESHPRRAATTCRRGIDQ